MSLVGSVFERKALGRTAPKDFSGSGSSNGFPAAQHRSKSAFAQRREAPSTSSKVESKPLPSVVPSVVTQEDTSAEDEPAEEWRTQIGRENDKRIDAMPAEQILDEQRELFEHFGEDLLAKFKARKAQTQPRPGSLDEGEAKHGPPLDAKSHVLYT